MNDCIFCKIVKGDIPSNKVYEDDYVLAFHDISPAAPVHVLVIPKKHIGSVIEIGPEDSQILTKIFEAINKVAEITGVDKTGFRLVSNIGKDGGQTVLHLHFHILGGKTFGADFG
jgi:histidine triad (HIT) family protein